MKLSQSLLLAGCAIVVPICALHSRAESPAASSKIIEVEWTAASHSPTSITAVSGFLPAPRTVPVAADPPPVPTTVAADPSPVPTTVAADPSPAPKTVAADPVAPVWQPNASVAAPGTSYPAATVLPATQGYAAPGIFWATAEYLAWWTKGNNLPPLVTSAPVGTRATNGLPGSLSNPATHTIFGNQRVNTDPFYGIRIRMGLWLDECGTCGIDGGFFGFGRANTNFSASSNGDPGLFRPFFNTVTGRPDVELVAVNVRGAGGVGFDPFLAGTVSVQNSSNFSGWDANLRQRLCGDQCSRLDGLIGYQYLRLHDVTSIEEHLVNTDPLERREPFGSRINIVDRFETTTTFNGVQVGLLGERRFGRWVASLRTMVAFGITHQQVNISGTTQFIAPDGTSTIAQGGLLTQTSNIGSYSHDSFSVIPQVMATLGYQITDHIRIFGGYSFLYWSQVVRSGDQINLNVNPTLIPNNGPPSPAGGNQPSFMRHPTDFWAQGFSVGLQVSW